MGRMSLEKALGRFKAGTPFMRRRLARRLVSKVYPGEDSFHNNPLARATFKMAFKHLDKARDEYIKSGEIPDWTLGLIVQEYKPSNLKKENSND